MPNALNLMGRKFGYLTVLQKAPNKGKKTYWTCQCDCGTIKDIQTSHLTSGDTTSCGCQAKAKNSGSFKDEVKECAFCGKEFIPNNHKRKYCYDCSPVGLSSAERLIRLDRLLKHKLVTYKGGKCERCGYDKCEAALQFHHIDPTEKDFSISHINLGQEFNLEKLYKEVDKCILLCANCHAEEHYKE